MKKIFGLSFLLTGFLLSAHSQIKSVKGHCGLYYKNMETLHKQQGAALGFYQFKPGQTIASIGAQCCHWEAAYAAASDSLHFWLEDIDSSSFNERQASFAWNYYDSLRGRPMTSTYQLILGDEKKTNLPDQAFDKILIINSFHEFSDQKEMLADIRKKLKPGGILYIDEALARKSGDLHGICNKPIYLGDELIAILKVNGFEYVGGLDKQFRKSKPRAKIFAFIAVNNNAQTLNDACHKNMRLQLSNREARILNVEVDTISHSKFESLVNHFYNKMINKENLTTEEDKTLLLLINTADWADFDKQQDIERKFPKIYSIVRLFDNEYYRYLYCKYSVFWGRGGGSYFKELQMQHLGTPFDCSRFYIRD